ncbi:MAG: NUDIX domain-containing protein [Candidatus Nomurabacteria bacterium]|nr:MAG: NUDIX domain-containing protein [Candidatus Nomurabacteria bacterium]
MVDITVVKHHIQKNILSILMHQKMARFRDMRPPRTDTNLYSYHLGQLLKAGLVKKTDGGYTLDTAGLVYIDRLNAEKLFARQQPKIVTMLVIQNSDGDVLLQRRSKQPYIDQWSLPHGKLHIEDASLEAAAKREAAEKLNVHNQDMSHAGDCYIRVRYGDGATIVTLAHVFTFNRDDIKTTEQTIWARPHKLHTMDLAPGITDVIARTFFRDPFYFEEFEQSV